MRVSPPKVFGEAVAAGKPPAGSAGAQDAYRQVADLETETGKRISPRVLLLNTLEQAAAALDQLGAPPTVSEPAHVARTATQTTTPSRESNLAGRVLRGLKGLIKG